MTWCNCFCSWCNSCWISCGRITFTFSFKGCKWLILSWVKVLLSMVSVVDCVLAKLWNFSFSISPSCFCDAMFEAMGEGLWFSSVGIWKLSVRACGKFVECCGNSILLNSFGCCVRKRDAVVNADKLSGLFSFRPVAVSSSFLFSSLGAGLEFGDCASVASDDTLRNLCCSGTSCPYLCTK